MLLVFIVEMDSSLWGADWGQRNGWQTQQLIFYETSTGNRVFCPLEWCYTPSSP